MQNLDLSLYYMIFLRITAAVIFGFALGLERELTNKYAGLRTHILVCLGSCVFTILSIYAFPMAVDSSHPQAFGDPARIAAQILTGIGFIGGGTVLRHGNSVYGLTTAATLWVAAAIGMACGTGLIVIALITTIIGVGVLVLIRLFERNVLISSTKNMRQLKIVAVCDDIDADLIHNYIIDNFDKLREISKKSKEENEVTINAIIDVSNKAQVRALYKKFEKVKNIKSLLIQENNE